MREIGMNLWASYVRMGLMKGVTIVRSEGGIQNFDTKLRDQISQGIDTPKVKKMSNAITFENH